jgi:archaellum component FlaD/FlaE
MLANPKNCEMVVLAHDGQGRLKLDGRCELELSETEEVSSFETKERSDGSSNADDRIGKNRFTEDVPKQQQQQHGEDDKDHAEVDKTAVVDGDETVYGEGQRSDNREEKKSTDEQETMGRSEKSLTTTATTTMTTTVVTGYKKHSRLRTLPPQWVRTRTVRMCYDDTAVPTNIKT